MTEFIPQGDYRKVTNTNKHILIDFTETYAARIDQRNYQREREREKVV